MSGFTSLGKKNIGAGGGGSNSNSTGPFGTALVSNMTPAAQGTFIHGINESIWKKTLSGQNSDILVSEGIATCSSGNSSYASATLRLGRNCKYRAGQGTMGRFTAIFDPGHADTIQLAGVGNAESGFYFAMKDTSFGILHREKSTREIREFTVTNSVGASVTLNVTLGDSIKAITISGNNDINTTAHQISIQDYSATGVGYSAESHGSKIYFIANVPGPLGGTFSIKNGATSIATAATTSTGVLPTETFIPQSSWNIDTMNGSGSSRYVLDATKGNVYGIGYQYLGFGNPVFSIENPETGLLTNCHMIQWAGFHTTTVIKDPTMTVKWEAINSGSLASSVSVKGASAGLFTEGLVSRSIGVTHSKTATKTSIGQAEIPIMSIRANKVRGTRCNYGEIELFNLSLGNDTGNSSTGKLLNVQIYKNLELIGPVNFVEIDSNKSITSADTTATGISVGTKTQLLKSIIIAANDSIILKLNDENFYVSNGETLTVTAKRVGNQDIDTAAVSISWFEDQ